MVSYATSSLVFGVVLLSVISSSYQIKCYDCMEGDITVDGEVTSGSLCPDEYTEVDLKDCPNLSDSCLKIEGSIDADITLPTGDTSSVSGTGTIRMCGNTTVVTGCNAIGGKRVSATADCYSCTEDGCNAASSLLAISFLSFIGTILAKFY